ncbi:MAG: hypothetical protein IPJ88_11935 [Myxococcales bacterium]|nr:MAG: hypothetical protein IPJ88_11935 [Myxococcales bacterium]
MGDATKDAPDSEMTSIRKILEPDGGQLGSATTLRFLAVPELLLFGLTKLLPLVADGPFEKTRWVVWFGFRNMPFAFELRKFGLDCRTGIGCSKPLAEDLLRRCNRLCSIVEEYFSQDLFPKQLKNRNFTVQNLYRRFDARYCFLREQAKVFLDKARFPFPFDKKTEHGSACAAAAIDAYFSKTEHFFVLAVAFAEKLPEDVEGFLRLHWGGKAKQLLDLDDDHAKGLYDQLIRIRDVWRNPITHGGIGIESRAIAFHVPELGACPAGLSRYPKAHARGFLFEGPEIHEVFSIFDEFDRFLTQGHFAFAHEWVSSGLNVRFDQEAMNEYRAAMKTKEEFSKYIDRVADEVDRHTNMDY